MTHRDERGFSLIEAVIAVSLMAVGVVSLAQVAVATARVNATAQRATVAQNAARERLEQLRTLAWTSEAGLVPVSDWSSDLTVTPPAATGGGGLALSPSAALTANTEGYCDFLDANGGWLARGTRAPVGATWTRRWSVSALDGLADTLILQVVVVPANSRGGIRAASTVNGTWLVTVRSRRAR